MPSLVMDFLHGVEGIGQTVASPFEYLGRTDIVDPARELLSGESAQSIQQSNKDLGLGAQGKNLAGGLEKFAGNVGQIGLDVAAPGMAGAVGKAVAPVADLGAGFGAKVAGGAIKGAAEGAAITAPQGVAQSVAQGDVNPKDLSMDFLKGAGMGAVTGGVLGGVGAGVKAAVPLTEAGGLNNQIPKASDQFQPEDLQKMAQSEDPKAIAKQLEPVTGKVVAQEIAPAVAKATDPHVVGNIVDNSVNNKIPTPDTTGATNPLPRPADMPPQTPVSNINTPEQVATQAEQGSEHFMNAPGDIPKMSMVMQEGTKNAPEIPIADNIQKGVTEGIQSSENFSPELQSDISSEKNQVTNKSTAAATDTFMKQNDTNTAHSDVLSRLQSGKIVDAQTTSDTGSVIQALDSQGRIPEASNLHDLLAERLEKQGQGNQAARIVYNRSPEGLYYDAVNTLDKGGVELKPELQDKLQGIKDQLKQLDPGTQDYADKVQELGKTVRDNIPSSTGDKIFGIWRAGLLTSSQILPKVAVSHIVTYGAETSSRALATSIDKFVSLFTGQRSVAFTQKGTLGGLKQAAGDTSKLLTKGIDSSIGGGNVDFPTSIQYGDSVPGKFMGAYVNLVGRLHGSIYKFFADPEFARSVNEQAILYAKNEGLKGAEADSYMAQFIADPPKAALDIAEHTAEYTSMQNATKLGDIAKTIQNKGGPLGKVIAPFTQIPSSIAMKVLDYSPAGAAKTIIDGIKAARSEEGMSIADQRAFSLGLGRSITGAGAIIPGIMLYKQGVVTLGYPTDAKEQQLWQDEGKIPNAVKVGGQWRSLASLGPMGSVLSIGAGIADSLVQGKDIGTATMNGFMIGAQSIAQASYLQGASQAINTINDPQKNATTFVKSLAGSVVPAISNSIAGATDPLQRQTTGDNLVSSAIDSIKSRIPGERETLAPKVDAFGNPLKSGETGLEKIVDPFASSTAATPSPLLTELRRLENSGFGEMPTAVTKKGNLGSNKQPVYVNLSRAQMQQLTTAIGQNTEQMWAQAISDPSYSSMSDMQKQSLLASLYGSAASQGKTLIAEQYKLGPFAQDLQQALQQSRQKRPQVV